MQLSKNILDQMWKYFPDYVWAALCGDRRLENGKANETGTGQSNVYSV